MSSASVSPPAARTRPSSNRTASLPRRAWFIGATATNVLGVTKDGASVGAAVGEAVGSAVGAPVGSVVGEAGTAVGVAPGVVAAAVGAALAVGVGAADGPVVVVAAGELHAVKVISPTIASARR